MDLIYKPVQVATSKPAQKGYINVVIWTATSIVLFCLAALAYILFYINYVPQIGIEKTVHFQFSDALQPWGIVHLGTSLASDQPYDITVHLDLPRSPANLHAGNFMLDMALLSPAIQKDAFEAAAAIEYPAKLMPVREDILFRSRRPAILTYSSTVVDVGKRMAGLPWYILGWRREAESLEISMAEAISFPRGKKNVPGSVLLEMKRGEGNDNIQVYDATIKIQARFGGLRWLMYSHRIFSFFVFTTSFWISEMIFAGFTWLILASVKKIPEKERKRVKFEGDDDSVIKTEDDSELETDDLDLSDTPRTFPTNSRQAPLRYTPKIKEETAEQDAIIDEATIAPLGGEADDESEEPMDVGNGYRGGVDSGIGTSMSESGGVGFQRRRSRGGRGQNS